MRRYTTLLLTAVALCGCRHATPVAGVVRASSPSEYPRLVGQRVELVGVVTQTKCPQILGVDLWKLDSYRGRKMRVTGILRQTVVTRAQLEEEEQQIGGPFANQGPGTFYHLDDLRYEPQP